MCGCEKDCKLSHDEKINLSTKKLTKEIVLERVREKQFEVVDDFDYINGEQKISIRCLICNQTYVKRIKHIYCKGCKNCSIQKTKHSQESIEELLKEKDIQIIGEFIYKNLHQTIEIKCLKCNKISKTKITNVLERRCCSCNNKHNNIIHTKNDIINKFKENNLTILSDFEYKNVQQTLEVCCNICNNKYKTQITNVLQGRKCKTCSINNQKLDKNNVIEKINNNGFDIDQDFTYINGKQKVNVICKQCGINNYIRIDSIISKNYGCKNCNIIKSRHSFEYIKDKFKQNNLEIIENNFTYTSKRQKPKTKCLKCETIYYPEISSVIGKKSSCPQCSKCKNEKLSRQYIEEIIQKSPNCQFKINEKIIINNEVIRNYILVDYEFEFNNKKYFVEINGEQHYQFTERFHRNNDSFENQKLRDKWLRKYCKSNNIILIEVDLRKYQEEDIKKYLFDILSNKQ